MRPWEDTVDRSVNRLWQQSETPSRTLFGKKLNDKLFKDILSKIKLIDLKTSFPFISSRFTFLSTLVPLCVPRLGVDNALYEAAGYELFSQ